jgi:hypothetical protein
MSIAVSVVVRRSRIFAFASLAMGSVLLCAALLLGRDGATIFHHGLSAACVLAGASISLFPLSRRKALRIDVSGIGQIRLVDTSPEAAAGTADMAVSSGEVVQLLRSSTFWSSLMVLRLQRRSGSLITLLIFPDSLDGDAFHALSVACLWAAARQTSPASQPAELSLPAD